MYDTREGQKNMMENDLHIISSVLSDKTVSQQVKNKIIKKLKVKKKKKQSGCLPFQKAAAFMLIGTVYPEYSPYPVLTYSNVFLSYRVTPKVP